MASIAATSHAVAPAAFAAAVPRVATSESSTVRAFTGLRSAPLIARESAAQSLGVQNGSRVSCMQVHFLKGALWCFLSFVVPIFFFFGFAVLWVAPCNVVGCVSAVGMSSLMLFPGWFVFAGMGPNGKQEVRDLVLLAAIDQWPNRQADWLYAREQLDPLPWIRLGKFCSLFGNCTMPIAVVKWKQWLTMCSADIR